MHNFRAVCFVACSFCLVVCVSANTPVSKGDATTAVEQAKASVTEVRNKAKNQLVNAQSLLQRVESSKTKAADAKVKSQKAAKDNTDAVAIAETIKSLSDEVDKLYATEKPKLSKAVNTLTALLSEAETLNDKADIQIEPNMDSAEDYSETSGKAAVLKEDAAKLDGQIDTAIGPIAGVGAKAEEIETKTKQAQLKDAHVSVIVDVATIDTILGKADTTIGQIEGKKNAVSGIVGEMQKDCTTELSQSNEVIKKQCQIANNALRDATGALENARSAKAAIETQKGIAKEALTKVLAENQEVSVAKNEASTAETCVRTAEQSFLQLNNALETANNSLTSATDSQQKLKTALSTTTTEQNTQQTKEKEETNLPVTDGTDSHQKDTTIQPTSKDSPDQSDPSAKEIKDKFINSAQNVPTTALTGGKAPTPGAKNDSAMTVSVPLLVALIASAVVQ